MNLYRAFYADTIAIVYASVAHAANDVWDANGANPPDGIWGTGANWVDNTTPGATDTAEFSQNRSFPRGLQRRPHQRRNAHASRGKHVTK
jgi:hypothetical protein